MPPQSSAEPTDQLKERVQQAASDTQQRLGDQLRSRITGAKDQTAWSIGSLGQTLVESSQQARERDPQNPVQYVERVGRELQRASDYLRRTDIDQGVEQVEGFARRQPAVFLGAAFAIGFLGARFMKSSQRAEDREQRSGALVSTSTGSGRISDEERPVGGFSAPGAYTDTSAGPRRPADISDSGSESWSGAGVARPDQR